MGSFKDKNGRSWLVPVDYTSLRRVKALLEVDLTCLSDNGVIFTLEDNLLSLGDILYVLCKDEADSLKITDEDFGRALGGDSLDDGLVAIVEGLEDFFPPLHRQKFRKMYNKVCRMRKSMEIWQDKTMDNKEMEAQMTEGLLAKLDSEYQSIMSGILETDTVES